MVAKECDLSPRSANELIKDLENLDLLSEITGYRRNWIFVFKPYLELFLNYNVKVFILGKVRNNGPTMTIDCKYEG